MSAWAVTSSSGKKRIHRADCRYARNPYNWAGDRSERDLFDALVADNTAAWHDAGQCCSYDLDNALYLVSRKCKDVAAIQRARERLADFGERGV